KELTQAETDTLLEASGIFKDDDWLDNLTSLLENNYGPSFSMHRYDAAEKLTEAKSLKEMLRIANEMTEEQKEQAAKLVGELEQICPEFFKIKFKAIGDYHGGMLAGAEKTAGKIMDFFRTYLANANKGGKKLLDYMEANVYKVSTDDFKNVRKNPDVMRQISAIENIIKNSVSIKSLVYDKVLTRASEILEQKKDIEGFLFQNDLLSRLKAALIKQDQGEDTGIPGLSSSKILREAILEDYPVAIIDEFQDTDPIQFSIVSQVYLNYFKDNRDAILTREHQAPDEKPWPNIQGFYIIGDPKQSIYLFRGADVSCYNDAVRGIGNFWGENDPNKKHQGTLGTNFRSNPVLVGQVNSLFESLSQDLADSGDSDSAASDEALEERSLSAPKHDDAADYHAAYVRGKSWQFSPVKSVMEIPEKRDEPQTFLVLRTPESSDGKAENPNAGHPKTENPKTVIPAPLTFFYHDFSDSKDSVNAPAMRRELAASCAREVVTVLNHGWLFKSRLADLTVPPDKLDEPVKLSDIAVLVSGKKEAKWISAELARYGVPAVYTSNRMSITETLEFESVYNLMEAFLNPKDNEKLRFLVSSSFFNYTAQDISEELSNGFEDISAALAEGVARWRDNDFMSAYCFFTKELDIIKNLSQVIGGDAIITNLNQAAEIAQSLSARASAFDGIVSLYRRLMDEPESDESSQEMSDYSIRAGGNENVIRITTYHSSKGLEYNIVFMPYAGIWKTTKKAKKGGFSPVSYLDSDAPEGEGRLRYDI
ncbi:UvrD-helicase domain-containing protein, partial [Succinimonas sp.]|uniref:UvrD-helicase domain-containing protein n=1 Tax=Succinimonas sp. TaxID=1936151 RepID=UPI00386CBFF1